MDQLKEKSRAAFDAQAASYDRTDKGSHARRLYPHVLAALEGVREGELLDVGCGTGALARLVLEQGPKRLLGRWFSSASWRRVEGSACIVEARK